MIRLVYSQTTRCDKYIYTKNRRTKEEIQNHDNQTLTHSMTLPSVALPSTFSTATANLARSTSTLSNQN